MEWKRSIQLFKFLFFCFFYDRKSWKDARRLTAGGGLSWRPGKQAAMCRCSPQRQRSWLASCNGFSKRSVHGAGLWCPWEYSTLLRLLAKLEDVCLASSVDPSYWGETSYSAGQSISAPWQLFIFEHKSACLLFLVRDGLISWIGMNQFHRSGHLINCWRRFRIIVTRRGSLKLRRLSPHLQLHEPGGNV